MGVRDEADRSLFLRFFDVDVSLESSVPEVLAPFGRLYRSFICERSQFSDDRSVLRFRYREPGPAEAILEVDGKPWPVSAALRRSGALYEFMLRTIYSRVQSHLLIHSSAIRIGQQGILIVADSGFGKTTLALSLVMRGAGFFSDEVGAIHRVSGCLEPFPRALRLSDESLALVDLDASKGEGWFGKRILPVEGIKTDAVAKPVRPSAVVFLADHRSGQDLTRRTVRESLEFVLNRLPHELLEYIGQLPGIQSQEIVEGEGIVTLKLAGEALGSVAQQIEQFCQAQQVCVFDAGTPVDSPRSYTNEATLESLAPKYGMARLLEQFLPGRRSRILRDEYAGQPARLLLEVMRLFHDVPCYVLQVGVLGQMVDQVEGLARSLAKNGDKPRTFMK